MTECTAPENGAPGLWSGSSETPEDNEESSEDSGENSDLFSKRYQDRIDGSDDDDDDDDDGGAQL